MFEVAREQDRARLNGFLWPDGNVSLPGGNNVNMSYAVVGTFAAWRQSFRKDSKERLR